MTDEKFVLVKTVSNPALAEIVKNALEDEGIPCFLQNEHQGGFVGVLGIQILVPSEHLAHAAAVIAEKEQPSEEEEDEV